MKANLKSGEHAIERGAAEGLILGVDGGGSKTAALIARVDERGEYRIIGSGIGGASNLLSAGKEQSLASLNQAITQAKIDAGVIDEKIDYAVLALAGSTSADVQRDVSEWAAECDLSSHLEIVNDVQPVLASGADDGCGIALVIGTGSVAVGVDRNGKSVIKGGWGHWFGDKGSGFYLGYKALAAVAEASDGIGPKTILSEMVMNSLGATHPRKILQEVTSVADTRRELAALAPVVLEAVAMNDEVAIRILDAAVREAAKLVAAVVRALDFGDSYALALAGGVICSSEYFRAELVGRLNQLDTAPDEITLVDKPVLGCLTIASSQLTSLAVS